RRHRAGPGSERNRHDTGTGSGTDRDSAPARRSLATRRVPPLVSAGRPNRGRRARRDRREAWDRGSRGLAVSEVPTARAVRLAVVVLLVGVAVGVIATLLWPVRLVDVPLRSRRDETGAGGDTRSPHSRRRLRSVIRGERPCGRRSRPVP